MADTEHEDERLEIDDGEGDVESGSPEGSDAGDPRLAGRGDDEGGDESEAGNQSSLSQAKEGLDRPGELRRQLREANERNARFERQLAEIQQKLQPAVQQPQEETEEQFRARTQYLPTEERVQEMLNRSNRQHQRELMVTRFQMAEANDKNNFARTLAENPRFKKYEAEVEQILQYERARNRDFPRDTILNFVLGQAVRKNAGKVEKARQQGQTRIAREQARPIEGRSDQAAPRRQARDQGDDLAAIRRRLDGVLI